MLGIRNLIWRVRDLERGWDRIWDYLWRLTPEGRPVSAEMPVEPSVERRLTQEYVGEKAIDVSVAASKRIVSEWADDYEDGRLVRSGPVSGEHAKLIATLEENDKLEETILAHEATITAQREAISKLHVEKVRLRQDVARVEAAETAAWEEVERLREADDPNQIWNNAIDKVLSLFQGVVVRTEDAHVIEGLVKKIKELNK